ncbi:MAG: adenylate/guanylate cyclase domain-containing protein [SAR324 cluster bacterium]|nr:adenylate/guanylate cyclase domain-containing protein [SAR324 cluster bacterium]
MKSIFCHKKACKHVADDVLLEKEVQGMKFHLYFKISLIFYLFASDFLIAHGDHAYKAHVHFLYATFLIIDFLLLHRLKHKKNITLTGVTCMLMDTALITILPFLWYAPLYAEGASSVFLLKTSMPLVAIGFIAINAMAIRPQYPAIMSINATLVSAFLFFFVTSDPNIVLSNNLVDTYYGASQSPVLYWVNSLGFLLFGAGLSFLTWNFRKTIKEVVNLEKANTQMGRYFSPDVASRIAQAENDFLQPGGKKQHVAVMFMDIRNFTKMSEELTPLEVTTFLSDYHNRIVKIIFQYGGTLDKFMGDGIMATFGTPETTDDDLSRALEAGVAIKAAMVQLNLERDAKGLPPIGQGIGLHFGEVIAGNIGTEDRLEYTVIGDTVNIASRLESACKETGANFIISGIVNDQLQNRHPTLSLGPINLKGKKDPMELFSVQTAT